MSSDLQKLTVPQLKALCKERGLTGYSKLSKSALVEKLAAGSDTPAVASTAPTSTAQLAGPKAKKKSTKAATTPTDTQSTVLERPPVRSESSTLGVIPPNYLGQSQQPDCPRSSDHTELPTNEVTNTKTLPQASAPNEAEQCQDGRGIQHRVPAQATRTSIPNSSPFLPAHGSISPSLFGQTEESGELAPKRQKTNHVQDRESVQDQQPQQAIPGRMGPPARVRRTIPVVIQPVNKEKNAHIPRGTTSTAKRYIPLVVKSKGKNPAAVLHTSAPSQPATIHTRREPSLPTSHLAGLFDFAPPVDEFTFIFKVITFPPTLSQRKFATKLAIILRDIRVEDMPSLMLTSRLFRYSAYLSAVGHLERWYPGERLNRVLGVKDISVDRMSLWEYRVYREREVEERMGVILGSKMVRKLFDGDVGVIGDEVWRSDGVRGLVVALRFLLTRCYFCVSLSRSLGEATRERVVDAQEVVKDEIWCITTEGRDEGRRLTRYFVLDATCEVIGSPVGPVEEPTRADWSKYIQKHVAELGSGKTFDIMDHVRWTNHEEYDRGISKVWLKRTYQEGDVGRLKREIAKSSQSFDLGMNQNSLSGRYMNSSEMEQELNGLPSKMTVHQQPRGGRVNLFVPAHHHVESVHLTARLKGLLHPALAIIQTPSREYFILKENGMQIGCEEEGVGEVWMEIVGCTAMGESVQ